MYTRTPHISGVFTVHTHVFAHPATMGMGNCGNQMEVMMDGWMDRKVGCTKGKKNRME